MDGRSKYKASHWYEPGNWSLPDWWTDWPPARSGHKWTYQELETFYSGWFVIEVLGHTGGMTTLPKERQHEQITD